MCTAVASSFFRSLKPCQDKLKEEETRYRWGILLLGTDIRAADVTCTENININVFLSIIIGDIGVSVQSVHGPTYGITRCIFRFPYMELRATWPLDLYGSYVESARPEQTSRAPAGICTFMWRECMNRFSGQRRQRKGKMCGCIVEAPSSFQLLTGSWFQGTRGPIAEGWALPL